MRKIFVLKLKKAWYLIFFFHIPTIKCKGIDAAITKQAKRKISKAHKLPIIVVSKTSNTTICSRTRLFMLFQVAKIQIGVKSAVQIIKHIEIPSIPNWYLIPIFEIQDACSNIWNPLRLRSKFTQIKSDTINVGIVVHNARYRQLLPTASSSPRVNMMKKHPANGRNVTMDNTGQSFVIALAR